MVFLRFLFVFSLVAAPLAAAEGDAGDERDELSFNRAAARESMASALMVPAMSRWDAEKMREINRAMIALPEPVAMNVLWLAASAPPRVDTTSIIATALSSPATTVRCQAIDVLLASDLPNNMRLVYGQLSNESNPEVIDHIVTAMARKSSSKAVRTLMEIMFLPNMKNEAITRAAEELRRLTRNNFPGNPITWRDWWLSNEHKFD